jgi:uncharacterized protein with FMN-binding domain
MTPSPSARPSLARRALPALVLTGASGLLLSALDRPGGSADASTIDTADGGVTQVSVVTPVPSATTAPATVPETAAPTTTGPAVVLPVPADTATTVPATVPPTAAPTTVASTVPPAPTCTVLDGPTVSTKWGPVQVEASITADGQLCTVDAIVTPSGHGKSVRINQRAVPVLDANAMAAQSTDFDGVSGATITSNAYKQSLQAIFDSVA